MQLRHVSATLDAPPFDYLCCDTIAIGQSIAASEQPWDYPLASRLPLG